MARLAILGGGFMGGALAEGLIDSGWSAQDIIVAEIREARRTFLTDHLKVPCTSDALAAAGDAASVLFAVKPQDIQPVLETVAPAFGPAKLAISICAGVRTAALERTLGEVPVIRAMPNTPAAIGQGATAIARGRFAREDHLASALNILSTVGRVVVVEESQMDAVTAVSGTGPAYLFYLAEAMISAAQKEGLTKEQAYVLVYQTLVGASELLSHDPAGPAELRARVTSPGGTTQAAIEHLERNGWREIFEQAVRRARERSEELGGS
jgi:pyrroline-5-carboxylate reductase